MRGGTGISLKQYPNKGPFYFITLQAAERTKREVAEEYSVHLFPPHPQVGGGTAAQDDEGAALDSDDDADAPKSAAPSRQPSNATHPYNIRKAAMALQRSPGRLPEERRRQIQAQVRRYVRAVELWLVDAEAEAPAEDAELTAAEVWAGLLAGMGGSSRRRTIRRWLKQGNELPARLVEPISQVPPQLRLQTILLIVVWQLANLTGFAWQGVLDLFTIRRDQDHRVLPTPPLS